MQQEIFKNVNFTPLFGRFASKNLPVA